MTNLDDDTVTKYAQQILSDNNSRRQIADQVGQQKLFNAIKSLATIDTKNVSLDEFKKIAEEVQK